jgi:hypothetical protein
MSNVDVPAFNAIKSSGVSGDAVTVSLAGTDGKTYGLTFPRGLIGPLMVTIVGQLTHLPAESGARRIETLPLKTIGAQAAAGPHGELGISIRLEGGLRLTLAVTPEVLLVLRSELAKLVDLQERQRQANLSKH